MLNKAVIDLRVIRKNALNVKAKLKKSTRLCAVVKADGYGHGAQKIASAIYNVADCFAVALSEEGVSLRFSGIDKDILVLTPCLSKDDTLRAIAYGLTLTVDSFSRLKQVAECARQINKTAFVHVKFNSGMNRYGTDSLEEVKKICDFIQKTPCVKLTGIYSHLANPQNKSSLNIGVNKFLLANNLVKGYNNKVISHISASGGFLQGVEFDMVRIGILLYGYKPFDSSLVKVKPAMKVYSPIVCERSLKKGQTALYGDLRLEKNLDLSLVRYGYADGLPRNSLPSQFNNRCMDVTATTEIKCGKYGALVMDNADRLAKLYHTISYEILTKSAIRAEKIYIT